MYIVQCRNYKGVKKGDEIDAKLVEKKHIEQGLVKEIKTKEKKGK